MSREEPVFSVILPTHDRPEMVRRAIESVLRQDFGSFELIVVDDGSTQSYASVFAELKNERIKVIRNTVNRGVAEARNIGVEAARGTYVAFIDDDDEYLSSFLGSTYKRLKGTPDCVGLSWCSVKHIDYPPETGGEPLVGVRTFATRYSRRQTLFEELLSIGTGFGVTIKRECLKKIGSFNVALKTVEDADLFFRFLTSGYVPVVVPGVQVVLHNHRQKRLTGLVMHAVRIAECEWLLREHAEFLRSYPTLREQLLWQINHLKQVLQAADGEEMAGGEELIADAC